jgi:homoaconitase/3-isopropylmalate dehydratase large subunit
MIIWGRHVRDGASACNDETESKDLRGIKPNANKTNITRVEHFQQTCSHSISTQVGRTVPGETTLGGTRH